MIQQGYCQHLVASRLPDLMSGLRIGLKAGLFALLVFGFLAAGKVAADVADIVDGKIVALGEGRYRIDATVEHADTGWDHYADRWDVLDENGNVLGVRELAHPHVDEQPFTRSLTLTIPEGVKKVILRANDSVHGLGGELFELAVP